MELLNIEAHSVSEALARGLNALSHGSWTAHEDSRNGGVTVWDGPAIIHYKHPLRRVLFSPLRNANPFFHLFESLWMLGGRNDLPFIVQFNQQMKIYSDDGGRTQPAAYGFRWRNYFGYDQIEAIIRELQCNPNTRRCVLTMWDGETDLNAAIGGSSDVPCNTHCYFTVRDGKLNMTVTCRSNDILWGAHGANAVHFSILLEYIAARASYEVGEMFQYSWNYHLYDDILKHPTQEVISDLHATDRYAGRTNLVEPTPIFDGLTMGQWEDELEEILEWMAPGSKTMMPTVGHPFLAGTVVPMFMGWCAWKGKNVQTAIEVCREIQGHDWQIACLEWMQRKEK